ncbi:ATP-binding cassette domain-containing protein [Microbispora hainanensis]|uniref:ATP-binding cassette domain-containing protein n=1 Tax=Microbispora hainanensis TaxID=568844 RepID=A0ABZ1SUL6_9ACTN|nr:MULTISPECIES: ATP-binding cassette domain-containing protein [Microbispora]NJP24621.1 ATP-binding cassette domain-containing protein [Microbispora sp. CL1-1]TQS14744.1 ATP-binding cassette domain-containing protein [Microbispora sp. SCL1-1]
MAAIEIRNLVKSFGPVKAVDGVSFSVEAGSVTGYLGPNGAGKTTTLRCLLGLVTPDSGEALVNGERYVTLANPVAEIGAVLEATSFHPGRTARNHLRVLCTAAGLPDARADEALEQVGLADAAGKRVSGFSLGMRQRLALASALLGRPRVYILDEPANGLDPAGIEWLRGFLRHLAHDQGAAVLLSSHVLAEVEQTVDNVVIIARGRLVRQGSLAELTSDGADAVRVRAAQAAELAPALEAAGGVVEHVEDGLLRVRGLDPEAVGRVALDRRVVLTEVAQERSGLHKVFLDLTEGR